MIRFGLAALAVACLAVAPLPAAAYIGPGAGLSAIGSVLAVLGAVLLLIAGFVWYPAKRALRALRARRVPETAGRAEPEG